MARSLSSIPLDQLYASLRPITVSPSSPSAIFQNWGETFRCTPLSVFEPESEYQLELILELARREKRSLRAVGVGHSPSDLACTSDFMVRMGRLNNILEVSTVHVRLSLLRCACFKLRSISHRVTFGFGTAHDAPRHTYSSPSYHLSERSMLRSASSSHKAASHSSAFMPPLTLMVSP